MKDKQKLAEEIFHNMENRLAELWEKLTTGNYNEATQLAYSVGFVCDIKEVLDKRCKE